jgi:hypothetical protein
MSYRSAGEAAAREIFPEPYCTRTCSADVSWSCREVPRVRQL